MKKNTTSVCSAHTLANMHTRVSKLTWSILHALLPQGGNKIIRSFWLLPTNFLSFKQISASTSFSSSFFPFLENNKFTLNHHTTCWPEAEAAKVKLHPRAVARFLCIKMSHLWSWVLIMSCRKASGQSLSLPQISCTTLSKSFSSPIAQLHCWKMGIIKLLYFIKQL